MNFSFKKVGSAVKFRKGNAPYHGVDATSTTIDYDDVNNILIFSGSINEKIYLNSDTITINGTATLPTAGVDGNITYEALLTVFTKVNPGSDQSTGTTVDLSNYYTKTQVDGLFSTTSLYLGITVATYAAAVALATGAQKLWITVVNDETAGGAETDYRWNGSTLKALLAY